MHRHLPSPLSSMVAALLRTSLALVALPGCPTGAEVPNAGYLDGGNPGQVDQRCRTGNRCDGTLRCVDDDGEDTTPPTCRARCLVDAPQCPAPTECRALPDDPGQGVCLPSATDGSDEDGSGEGST